MNKFIFDLGFISEELNHFLYKANNFSFIPVDFEVEAGLSCCCIVEEDKLLEVVEEHKLQAGEVGRLAEKEDMGAGVQSRLVEGILLPAAGKPAVRDDTGQGSNNQSVT